MSGHAPDFTPTYNAIPGRKVSSTVKGLCGLGVAIGLVAAGMGFTGDEVSLHRAQGAFITNFMSFHESPKHFLENPFPNFNIVNSKIERRIIIMKKKEEVNVSNLLCMEKI